MEAFSIHVHCLILHCHMKVKTFFTNVNDRKQADGAINNAGMILKKHVNI